MDRFSDFLGERDLLAAMVFNNQSKLLSKMEEDDDLFKNPKAGQSKGGSTIVIQTSNGQQIQVNP